MLLYVVEQESSRTLCCKVYKRIGVVFRRPCLLECDKRRVYIWQRPCLCKCDGGRNLICKPSVCLLWSFHTCPIHPNWVDSSEALYDSTRFPRNRSTLPLAIHLGFVEMWTLRSQETRACAFCHFRGSHTGLTTWLSIRGRSVLI